MLTLNTRVASADSVYGEMVLPFSRREKSRQRATLVSGEEVGVFTVRGTVLRDGDLLRGTRDDGSCCVVRVVAAREETCRVTCASTEALLRCAFHLGNRHTQAQVGTDFLRIRRDPVLQDMLVGLGATVTEEHAEFEPESGAYGGGHGHGDGHSPGLLLAPVPLRQKIHRPNDPVGGS